MIGAVDAIVTLAIGYYMVYREIQIGLCFESEHPGLGRACILDLGGGVMSMVLGILLLLFEFASAYINQRDVSCLHLNRLMIYHLFYTVENYLSCD